MTREEAIGTMNYLKHYAETDIKERDVLEEKDRIRFIEALEMAIKALERVGEIHDDICNYMRKYPNHVGNTDFWEGFFACRNVVEQLDDEDTEPPKQQPCEDAISREALITKLMELIKTSRSTIEIKAKLIPMIEQLPPVTQKSGKWIDYQDGRWIYAKCSECGTVHDTRTNYCPNCGACMKDGRTLDEFIEDSKESEE